MINLLVQSLALQILHVPIYFTYLGLGFNSWALGLIM